MKTRFFLVILVLISISFARVNAQTLEAEVARKTSAVFAGAPGNTTPAGGTNTNRDFFSAIVAALESLNKSDGEAVTFDWNFDVLGLEKHRGKLQLVMKKPDIGQPVIKALTGNDAALAALRNELSYTDDATFSISIAPMEAEKSKAAVREFARHARASLNNLRTTFSGVDDATLIRLQFRKEAEDTALVIANQTKFTFDAAYHARRNTVGPNEWLVKGTYEWGAAKKPEATQSFDLFRSNMRAAAEAVDKQYRFAVSIEAHLLDANPVKRTSMEPVYSLDVPGKRSHSYVGSVSFGFDVYRPDNLENRGRLEFGTKFEDVTDDPNRRDRWITNITYSQRVSETVSIPISLIYANHSDYLTNVDRKLNAHFGIAYKVPPLKALVGGR